MIVVQDSEAGEGGRLSGAAFVFRFDGVEWFEEQKLVASDGMPGDGFGRSAFSGDRLLVVAPHLGGEARPGAAYVFEAVGPSVELKIDDEGAVYPHAVVRTEGTLKLTLDMKAGSAALDHYYFWWTAGTFYWLTAGGVSDTRAPLDSFAPVDLTDFPLADTPLTPGDWVFGWLMLDGETLVDRDFIVAHVAP